MNSETFRGVLGFCLDALRSLLALRSSSKGGPGSSPGRGHFASTGVSVFPFAVEEASKAAASVALAAWTTRRRDIEVLVSMMASVTLRNARSKAIVAKTEDAGPADVVERYLFGLTNTRRLAELLGHVEVMLERRQRFAGPILQFGTVAALGIAFEQRHCIFVRADLV